MKTPDGKTVVILPYGNGKSAGANDLAKALGITKIEDHNSITPSMEVINWGNGSYAPTAKHKQMVNTPPHIEFAVDKLTCLARMSRYGVRTPEWTTSREEALKWFRNGDVVVCRTTTTGYAGKGIYVTSKAEGHKEVDLPSCPLYTKFIKWTFEYRVHMAFGKSIHVRKKIKPANGVVTGDPRIASHLHGWLFIKEIKDGGGKNFNVPPDVLREAAKALPALGLDFGGVDVVYDQMQDKAFVLEVNTAPGLEVSEVNDYAKAFKSYYKAA